MISDTFVWPCVQNAPKNAGEASPVGCTRAKSAPDAVQWPGGVIISPTWLGLVLAWSKQNYLKLLNTVRYFESS